MLRASPNGIFRPRSLQPNAAAELYTAELPIAKLPIAELSTGELFTVEISTAELSTAELATAVRTEAELGTAMYVLPTAVIHSMITRRRLHKRRMNHVNR